ncbi:MAG: nucleoside-triphosphatase [Candidatus Odinarchaeota archaeon]
MVSKILITGPPRSGKSTLISKLIEFYFKKNFIIRGFLTPEVREKRRRIGFDLEEISSDIKFPLARIGDYKTKYKLGKYSVFMDEFEKVISILEKYKFEHVDLIVIDEIGRMELFSEKFQYFIIDIFKGESNIIATIGKNIKYPFEKALLNISNLYKFDLSFENQQDVYQKIINLIN